MKYLIILLAAFCFCACGDDSKLPPKEREKINPASFIKVNHSLRKNLVGRQVIEGKLINTGTSITYKSVTLRLECETKDNGTQTVPFTVNESLAPGKSVDFKYKPGFSCETVEVTVKSAIAE